MLETQAKVSRKLQMRAAEIMEIDCSYEHQYQLKPLSEGTVSRAAVDAHSTGQEPLHPSMQRQPEGEPLKLASSY